MDRIFINGLQVHTVIGVNDWERTSTQLLLISLSITTDTQKAGESDNIADCVNYDTLGQKIRLFVERSRRFTVEALAADIAQLCLNEFGVKSVTVRIEKPGAIPEANSAGVEIERIKEAGS